ncbi:MAG: delta-60 repeat domain-containing protein [Acidobacteriota bacterium]
MLDATPRRSPVRPSVRSLVRSLVRSFACALFVLLLATAAHAGPDGDIDFSFGTGGVAEVAVDLVAGGDDLAEATVVQPDGKVLVLATVEDVGGYTECAVLRLEPGGTLDGSFGGGGITVFSFGAPGTADDCRGLAIHRPSGQIVVAGTSGNLGSYDAAVARLLPNGTLDGSFGTGGRTTVDLGSDEELFAVTVHPDGRIFAAGSYRYHVNDTDILMLELSSGGTFTRESRVYFDLGTTDWHDRGEAILLHQGGKVVVAGTAMDDAGPRTAVVRFQTGGGLDPSFGTGGKVDLRLTGLPTRFAGIDRQVDDKLVLAGTILGSTFVEVGATRLHAAGNVDTTYGFGGLITASLGSGLDGIAHGAQLDGAERLVIFGNSDGDRAFAALRLEFTGHVDAGFGSATGGGFEALLAPTGLAPATAVDLGPNGEIILAGSLLAHTSGDLDVAAVKLHGSGGPPADQR